jgi:hypothetical protein
VRVVYFKSEDDGDGTYEGQIGHAYLHLDDGRPVTRDGISVSSRLPRLRVSHASMMQSWSWMARRERNGMRSRNRLGARS